MWGTHVPSGTLLIRSPTSSHSPPPDRVTWTRPSSVPTQISSSSTGLGAMVRIVVWFSAPVSSIVIPPLSADVRRKMSSRIKELAEEARVAIRNVRRDANKAADGEQSGSDMTEDDCKRCKDDVQELTKKHEGLVGDLAKTKEAEVMEE